MDQQMQQQLDAQEDRQLTANGASAAMSSAQRKQERKLQNGHFLNELRDPDVDSDVHDWLTEEFPTWFSGAHAVTNRGDEWDQESDLLMMNKRERVFAERNPGRLLRDRPVLLAIAQGRTDSQQPQPLAPMTSEQRRTAYGGAEVAADLMTLSRNAAGLDATTTATTETRVRRDKDEGQTASKIGKVFE